MAGILPGAGRAEAPPGAGMAGAPPRAGTSGAPPAAMRPVAPSAGPAVDAPARRGWAWSESARRPCGECRPRRNGNATASLDSRRGRPRCPTPLEGCGEWPLNQRMIPTPRRAAYRRARRRRQAGLPGRDRAAAVFRPRRAGRARSGRLAAPLPGAGLPWVRGRGRHMPEADGRPQAARGRVHRIPHVPAAGQAVESSATRRPASYKAGADTASTGGGTR